MTDEQKKERLVTIGLSIGIAKADLHDRRLRLNQLEQERAALMQELYPAVWTSKGTNDPGPRFSI